MASWIVAKELLTKEIIEGRIPDSMEPKDVYEMPAHSNIFKKVKFGNFKANLKSLRTRLQELKSKADVDKAAWRHDRQEHPIDWEKRWQGTSAATWLKRDIDDNLHKSMTPKQLHATRSEYQAFSLEVFRKHIHQEQRSRIEGAYWIALKKAKAEKKAGHFVQRKARRKTFSAKASVG